MSARSHRETTPISVRFTPAIAERLRAESEARDLSVSWLVDKACREFLDRLIPVDEFTLTRPREPGSAQATLQRSTDEQHRGPTGADVPATMPDPEVGAAVKGCSTGHLVVCGVGAGYDCQPGCECQCHQGHITVPLCDECHHAAHGAVFCGEKLNAAGDVVCHCQRVSTSR